MFQLSLFYSMVKIHHNISLSLSLSPSTHTPLQQKTWLNKNSLMSIQLYNCLLLNLQTHEAIPFNDKHTNRKVMISDMSTHHWERTFQKVQTFLSTVFSQRTQHSNADVSHGERSNKRSPHKRLTENRETKWIRESMTIYNTNNSNNNTATTVPKVLTLHQHTAYRLSLESDRDRLGERLLDCDLLCERLRGECDLEQQGNTLNCVA
jgi:hypothetical protein